MYFAFFVGYGAAYENAVTECNNFIISEYGNTENIYDTSNLDLRESEDSNWGGGGGSW